ncbi:hypothetical protein V1478_011673 [Vespula squamosa]|uniref:Uncharacterized protein n=1 Tax=Vespula squamosa TaxID=30214 RepID=A0ABD2AF55_VESSQ
MTTTATMTNELWDHGMIRDFLDEKRIKTTSLSVMHHCRQIDKVRVIALEARIMRVEEREERRNITLPSKLTSYLKDGRKVSK